MIFRDDALSSQYKSSSKNVGGFYTINHDIPLLTFLSFIGVDM